MSEIRYENIWNRSNYRMFIDIFQTKKCEGFPRKKSKKKIGIFLMSRQATGKKQIHLISISYCIIPELLPVVSRSGEMGYLSFQSGAAHAPKKQNKYPTWSETYIKMLRLCMFVLVSYLLKKSFSILFL